MSSPAPERAVAVTAPGKPFMAFVADEVTRTLVERAAQDAGFTGEVYVGDTQAALAALADVVPARYLVLDLSDQEDPIAAINAFADLCHPDTRVLVLVFWNSMARDSPVSSWLYSFGLALMVAARSRIF